MAAGELYIDNSSGALKFRDQFNTLRTVTEKATSPSSTTLEATGAIFVLDASNSLQWESGPSARHFAEDLIFKGTTTEPEGSLWVADSWLYVSVDGNKYQVPST